MSIDTDDQIRFRPGQTSADPSPRKSTAVNPSTSLALQDEAKGPPRLSGIVGVVRGPWVRLVIFFLACFFTSPLYYGWQQFALMLARSGAYSWLCEPDDLPPSDWFQCEAQEKAIGRLYSIAAGCEYASAAWGGILLDTIGPRMSGLIGECVWALGTLLMALSSEKTPMYIPAMIIIGSSVNVVAFPSLVTIETWPQWRGLMVGFMLAAATAATLIPPVLWTLWNQNESWSFKGIWLVYLVAIWLPISALYATALPGARDYQNILKLQRKEILEAQQREALAQHKIDDKIIEDSISGTVEDDGSTVVASSRRLEPSINDEDVQIATREATWKEFGKNVITLDMMMMAVWFFCMMCTYAYYATVVRSAISPTISQFLGWFMPTQAIWSLAVGFLCDWFRTPWVMVGMCACLIVVFSISLTNGSLAPHYFAATILTISQCAIFEVKFTFVSEMFDPYHYGKLVGFLGVVGGIGTFMNIPIADGSHYNRVFIAYICTLPALIVIAAVLGSRQRRGKTYKSLPETLPRLAAKVATPEEDTV